MRARVVGRKGDVVPVVRIVVDIRIITMAPICMSCDADDVPIKTFEDMHGDLWLCEPCADEYPDAEWSEGRSWRAALG